MTAPLKNDYRDSLAILDQFGKPISRAEGFGTGAPYIPDGAWNYGFYDAVNYSANRSARPFFAVDSHFTLTQWPRLRAMSLGRWGYINVPALRGAVDLNARLTVGTGFSPLSQCADKGLGKAADEYYKAMVQNIGFMAGESMDELLVHDSRCVDVDGDKLDVMTADEFGNPKLQFIEAHRIRTGEETDPRCRDGVWVDDYARRVGYNIALPGDEPGRTRRVDAFDAIYMAERNRPDELRSMTNLIHALAPLQDLYEILNFAMISVKKNTEIALVIKTDTQNDPPGIAPQYAQEIRAALGGLGTQPPVPAQAITREQIFGGGGKVPILRPNESMQAYAHAQPAASIEGWSEFIIRCVAVGFGIPFEILWNPEAIGGANTRLITALLRQRLLQRRAFLILPKLRRVRFWLLSKAIKRGIFPQSAAPQLLKAFWCPNFSDITVDAGRESKERRANVLAGLDTYTGYYQDNGEQYSWQLEIRSADIESQCAKAEGLCQKYPKLDFQTALLLIAGANGSGATIRDTNTASDDGDAAKTGGGSAF